MLVLRQKGLTFHQKKKKTFLICQVVYSKQFIYSIACTTCANVNINVQGPVVQSIVSAYVIVKVNVNFNDNVNCCSKKK